MKLRASWRPLDWQDASPTGSTNSLRTRFLSCSNHERSYTEDTSSWSKGGVGDARRELPRSDLGSLIWAIAVAGHRAPLFAEGGLRGIKAILADQGGVMCALPRRHYDWNAMWSRHLENYLAGWPCAGMMMAQSISDNFDTTLEIACGSARDSLYLHSLGKHVVAIDSNQNLILSLQQRFRDLSDITFKVEDALRMSFKDNEFDLSFHNGFYILFDDDDQIISLLREQCRVTKKHVLFFVHNAHNPSLQAKFNSAAREESHFDIRFFERDHIMKLVRDSGVKYEQMSISKFGGPVDLLLSKTVKGIPNPLYGFGSGHLPTLYSLVPLRMAERLVCHLTL